MCTAISFQTKDHYFGRTLDLHYSYDESVVITPRNYPFHFKLCRLPCQPLRHHRHSHRGQWHPFVL